jgi:hypothetical protein
MSDSLYVSVILVIETTFIQIMSDFIIQISANIITFFINSLYIT